MNSKNYSKGIAVRAYQHGGEKRSYGKPVKAVLAFAKTGKNSLNLCVHVGMRRRVAAIVEVDACVLGEAAREILGNAGMVAREAHQAAAAGADHSLPRLGLLASRSEL